MVTFPIGKGTISVAPVGANIIASMLGKDRNDRCEKEEDKIAAHFWLRREQFEKWRGD